LNAAEYANMERMEDQHWYYAGKRQFVRQWIEKTRLPVKGNVLLDCGAGTGRFAQEMEDLCAVMVLDDHEEALRILRTKFQPDQILSLAGDQIPLPPGSLDYITALDVLEHVPDDFAVVRGFHKLLKPGGLAVITVPAGMALWSDWDVVLHHYRRYSRTQLQRLFPSDEWEIVHANYTNVLVYPAAWVIRKWQAWRTRVSPGTERPRAEDALPPRWLNALLKASFVQLAHWRIPFPFGVSLLLVARRRVPVSQASAK
jgi:2-polyprenyl-3-methyl-5-hydroxy-6-metoxy-1,4-benzoquinol methylase